MGATHLLRGGNGRFTGFPNTQFTLSRPEWKAGGQLTASELNLEQKYQTELLRHHLRFLHGWGILCGLTVVPAGDPKRPWVIRVCPGYGVNPCGDEIAVAGALDYDLEAVAWRVPTGAASRIAFIGARFVSSPQKSIPVVGHAHQMPSSRVRLEF